MKRHTAKKWLALLLVMLLALTVFVGCDSTEPSQTEGDSSVSDSSESEPQSSDAGDEGEKEVTTLSIYLMTSNVTDDIDTVEAAINEIVEPEIGVNVDVTFINSGSYNETVATMVRSGDPLDICFLTEANLRSLVSQDAVTPLSSLLEEYGDGIAEAVGDEFMDAAYIAGEIYAIPSMKDMAMSRMLVYNKEMAEEVGVVEELDNVKTIADLTPIYEKVAAAYPDIDMFGGAPNAQTFESWGRDNLSDSLGVLMNPAEDTTVVNLFETDEYMEDCKVMRTWYNNGWIDRDIATGTDFWNARLKAKTAFSGITSYKPGNVETCSIQVGYELGYVILTEGLRTTSTVMNATLSIPASSENPEKAMQFLQKWYTDSEVATLLIDGVEGVHYQVEEDGTIGYIGSADDCTYYNYSMGWIMGNQFITPVWTGSSPDVWDQTREWNESSVVSKAFSFAFDNSSVLNEITACTNVLTKYRGDLETGTIDPEENIPKFIEELKANGIDTIIAEKQAQLDAFLAEG